MVLSDDKIKQLEEAYKDPNLGLGGASSFFNKLKNKIGGLTLKDVKEWMKQQEVIQVMEPRSRKYNSFVAGGPLQQFQIDLIYMPESWHNNNYKYVLACVDVFSKKAEMIPMKEKTKKATVEAFESILKSMGIPKTVYSDQGKEFDNKEFNDLLRKYNIMIIFASDHAPFVEAFNKTMKNRLYKYMALNQTKNWVSALDKLVDVYNNTPHSATKVAPNKVNEKNKEDILLRLNERAKTKTYETIKEGDTVRVPIKNRIQKGYKQQWSYQLFTVQENKGSGVYKVNNDLYPRKELQLIKNVVKQPQKSEQQIRKESKADDIGVAMNKPEIKRLTGPITKSQAKELYKPRETRNQSIQTQTKQKRNNWMTIDKSNIVQGKRRK